MYDLSLLIPGRNEEFIIETIEDILRNKRGNTEIIVGLDGYWPAKGIPQHPDVTVFHAEESLGQRGMTKQLARISQAKYIAKADAHCAFDEGFDVKMLEAFKKSGDDVVMVPVMRNLHVFDWVCEEAHRRYQGPSGPCTECGKPTTKDIVWHPKESPRSTSYSFNREPKFRYFNEYTKRPEYKRQLAETGLTESMSLQGSFFMMNRQLYFDLGLDDEAFGSWGSQGIEVACKFWLSGRRVLVNHATWYAHMFRTQGGDFSFPYPLKQSQVDHAKQVARELFIDGKWPHAVHDLQWLLDKFAPVPDWHTQEDYAKKPCKGVIYYTDNQIDEDLMQQVQKQITKGIKEKHVVSVSLQPIKFGKNIHLPLERGYLTMAKQILAGLEACPNDVVFFCEHDVLYHPSHFDFIPPDREKIYYNTNVWKIRQEDGFAVRTDDCRQLSGLCAWRDVLIKHYKERVRRIEEEGFTRRMGFEPGIHNRKERVDDLKSDRWESKHPNIDIRHDKNLTGSRWSPDQYRNKKYAAGWQESHLSQIPGWEQTALL